MGILLRLGDPQLGQAQLGDILTENVLKALLGKSDLHIWHGGVIGGGADIVHMEEALFPFKAGKLGIHKGPGDLPGPVRPEVHKDDGVSLTDLCVLRSDDWYDKLIGDVGGVAGRHSPHRITDKALLALAVDHGLVGLLHPVPVGVPVHGVVAA